MSLSDGVGSSSIRISGKCLSDEIPVFNTMLVISYDCDLRSSCNGCLTISFLKLVRDPRFKAGRLYDNFSF